MTRMGWLQFGILMLIVMTVQANHKHRRGRVRKVFKRPQQQKLKDAECHDCEIDKARRYTDHPESCEKFIEEYTVDGKHLKEERVCPSGLFWDSSSLVCNHAHLVHCKIDPCKTPGKVSYDIDTLCGCYFVCVDGCSALACCRNRQTYDSTTGVCATNDTCPLDPIEPTECTKEPVENDTLSYVGDDGVERQCPQFTSFDVEQCGCYLDTTLLPTDCVAEVDLQFDGNFHDSSRYHTYAEPNNLQLVDGSAEFKGDGMINIYRFSNDAFGYTLTINIRFKQATTAKGLEALVTNCIYNEQQRASVLIMVDADRSVVIFKARTERGVAELRVPFTPGKFNDATFTYNGERLYGIVDDGEQEPSMKFEPLTGKLLTRRSGIVIGAGSKLNCFNGLIDEFQLYKCCPDFVKTLLID